MRWLLLSLALVFGLAQSQPAEAPKGDRAAKGNPATDGKQGKKSESDKGSTSGPAPLVIPLAIEIKPSIAQQTASAVDDEDRQHRKEQLQAEKDTAFYTGLLVVVGFVTAAVLAIQSALIRNQVKLARAEYLASHPPKLVVRRVCELPERPGFIQWIIVNVGESDADIVNGEVRAWIDMKDRRPFFPPYNTGKQINQLGGKSIKVGALDRRYEACAGLETSKELIESGTHEVMLIGWMTFENGGGTRGYTSFARVFDPVRRGFVMVEDVPGMPEYDRWEYRN